MTTLLDWGSDPAAQWQVIIGNEGATSTAEVIGVDGSGNFWRGLPIQRTFFPYLALPGHENILTLTVDRQGQETLRFNREIAWHGLYPLKDQPATIRLSANGGWRDTARISWLKVALYSP